MKIENVTGPSVVPIHGAQADTSSTMSALERAKAAFMRPTTASQANASSMEQSPVGNQNSVSPEEYAAAGVPKMRPSAPQSGQEDNIESASHASPEAPAESRVSEKQLSSQYAALARQAKALRIRDQQLKAREEAIRAASEPKSPISSSPAFDESKYVARDRLTQDPFTVLNELGLTYDQLTELALNAPKPEQLAVNNQIKALQEEIKALRGETENTKKSFEEQQEQQNQQALTMMRNEAKKLVQADASFELIRSTPGAIGEVVKLIESTYYEDGDLLSVEEAAQKVEDYLTEEAIKFSRLDKIQQRLQANRAAPAASLAQKSTAQPEQQPLKTLTNSVSSSRKLTAKERALLAFRGELKK